MIKRVVAVLMCSISFAAMSQTNLSKLKVIREGTEWCDIWIPSATSDALPRVLLVGDSITKGYYNSAARNLKGKAVCARLATSACISDPAFHMQLAAMFNGYNYSVIHFNNGLHGFGYTEEEYRVGYEMVLKSIKKEAPKAKLILALSTPLKSNSNSNSLNPRVDARNKIVRELAGKYGAEINDLHAISKGHPAYYRDAYHYKLEAIELQGKQVGEVVAKALKRF